MKFQGSNSSRRFVGKATRQAVQHAGETSLGVKIVGFYGLCRPPNYAERFRNGA
jgi:hypothetical protein